MVKKKLKPNQKKLNNEKNIEWPLVRLGDYCKVLGGYAFKSKDFTKEGILVVKIGNIQDGTVVIDNRTNYFPKTKITESIKKFILNKGDILIALTGATTGKIGLVPQEHEGTLLNQRVGKFDIFNKELDATFFRFYCLLPEFQDKIKGNILKSAQGNISPKQIENIKLYLPPLNKQKDIAEILATIYENIEKEEKKKLALQELFKSMLNELMYNKIEVSNNA